MRNIPTEFAQCARSAASVNGSKSFSPVFRRDLKILFFTAKNAVQSWNSLTRTSSMNTATLSIETGIQKRIPVSFFFFCFIFQMDIRHIPKFKLIFLFAGAFAALSKPKRAEFLICQPHRNFMARFLCILHKYGNPIKKPLDISS